MQKTLPAPQSVNSLAVFGQPSPALLQPTLRVRVGRNFTDSDGNLWMGDTSLPKVDSQDAVDGVVVQRGPDVVVAKTDDPELYRYERYNVRGYHLKVPAGTSVLLHFRETYNDAALPNAITGPGQRVFDVSVNNVQVNEIDPWGEAGGPRLAVTRTVEGVGVTDGKLEIRFTGRTREPMINAFEVVQVSTVPAAPR